MTGEFVADLLFTLTGIGIEVFFFLNIRRFRLFGLFWESGGLELYDAFKGVGGEALALGLIALDGNKLLGIDLLSPSEVIGTAIGELDAGVGGVGEQDELRLGILREPVLFLFRGIHLEFSRHPSGSV